MPDMCPGCVADPGDSDSSDNDDNELPYLDGLRTCIEWEAWFADRAMEIVEAALACDDKGVPVMGDSAVASMWGQAFKFARQAHTEASVRERQYLTQKHQREIAALRASNDAVMAIAPVGKHVRPVREDGN